LDPFLKIGIFKVTNEIGVSSNTVEIDLLDEDCAAVLNMTGHGVELYNENFTSSPFVYNISLDNFLSDDYTNAGLVSFTGNESTGNATGEFRFCTRVSTREDTMLVAFRETKFNIGFDMTDNEFTVDDIGILDNNLDNFETLIDPVAVIACQCEDEFVCFSAGDEPGINQDMALEVCLYPSFENTFISNFELVLKSPDSLIEYRPVEFGTSGWEPTVLTKVEERDNQVKTTTVVISDFYTSGYESLNVTGNALVEFDVAKTSPVVGFEMVIGLSPAPFTGCVASLFKTASGFFKRSLPSP